MSSQHTSDQKLLEVKDLVVHYGKVQALRGVSIGIPEGAFIALIGANGAGKSTTLQTISGLIRPTSGSIWFQGKRIDKLPPYKITELGIIHRLQKENPGKKFIQVSEQAICPDMKLITLEKVLRSLETMAPQITIPEDIRLKAKAAVDRMLAIV